MFFFPPVPPVPNTGPLGLADVCSPVPRPPLVNLCCARPLVGKRTPCVFTTFLYHRIPAVPLCAPVRCGRLSVCFRCAVSVTVGLKLVLWELFFFCIPPPKNLLATPDKPVPPTTTPLPGESIYTGKDYLRFIRQFPTTGLSFKLLGRGKSDACLNLCQLWGPQAFLTNPARPLPR